MYIKQQNKLVLFCPYKRDIFQEDEFAPSMVTDRPVEEPRATPLQSEPEAMPVQSKLAAITENVDESMKCASPNVLLHPQNVYTSPAELFPLPKAAPRISENDVEERRPF